MEVEEDIKGYSLHLEGATLDKDEIFGEKYKAVKELTFHSPQLHLDTPKRRRSLSFRMLSSPREKHSLGEDSKKCEQLRMELLESTSKLDAIKMDYSVCRVIWM